MKIRKLKDRNGEVYTPLVSIDSVYNGSSSIKSSVEGAVQGPSSSVSNNIPLFSGTKGKTVTDSGITVTKTTSGADVTYTITLA